ncbi:MAG: Trk system potassium transporter TrkA [bacterium]|jgi:trk system potassium uptake protein TrkA
MEGATIRIIVIGLGKVGTQICTSLREEGHDLVAVDTNENKLTEVSDSLDIHVLKGNGASVQVLKEARADTTDLLIAVTDSDETNMIACLTAKHLGVAKTIARVRDPDYVRSMVLSKLKFGIDMVINPERSAAVKIARLLTNSFVGHTEEFAGGKLQLAQVTVETGMPFAGKQIKDISLPRPSLVVTVSRNGHVLIPGGSDTIAVGDHLHVLGNRESISRLFSLQGKKPHRVERVIILGGGKIGFYLADALSAFGIKVKIVELDEKRCLDLAERLPSVLVLHGDGTDLELLRTEGLADTDAFVAVTGMDEENLLMALLAKQMGVKRAIAKISRPAYGPIVEQLGVDSAISPRLITVGEILQFVSGGKIESLSLLLDGRVEVAEFIIGPRAKIRNKKLAVAGLPRGVIVGAVVRGERVIVPDGNEIIQKGDRVVVFCLKEQAEKAYPPFIAVEG